MGLVSLLKKKAIVREGLYPRYCHPQYCPE
jgi:hypothetical protein